MALTSKKVIKLLRRGEPGRHLDRPRSGLYLVIESKTNANWTRRFVLDGKEHYHGLGSASVFTLAEARVRNRRISQMLADGRNPIAEKRAAKAERIAERAKTVTFGEVAADYFNAHSPGWGHPKHVQQWRSSVLGQTMTGAPVKADYCKILRPLPVQSIDTPLVLSALKPLWQDKPNTMARVRARIHAVLDYATAAQYRTGDNPAAANLVGKLLPARGKSDNHFAAIPYVEIPDFVATLRAQEGAAARCLEFLIYVSARSQEAREATWGELKLGEAVWEIPAERMKADRPHIVPLAPEVIELLRSLPCEGDGDDALVFLGTRPGKPLSDLQLMTLMRKLGRSETVHGFRSSFSDWAHERTAHSNHAIEISLAHAVGGAQERAYRRGDMLEKRRRLMADWAKYCTSPPAAEIISGSGNKVVGIGGRR
jgi:integrase